MPNMKFNEFTKNIALTTLALYGLYALFVLGIASIIMSLAIGLIAAAFVDQIEIIVAIVVISGMVVSYFIRNKKSEGFSDGNPAEISGRIQTMMKGYKPQYEGVYDAKMTGASASVGKVSLCNGFSEGFANSEDAEGASSTGDLAPADAKPTLISLEEDKNKAEIDMAPTPEQEKKDVMKTIQAVKEAGRSENTEAFAGQTGLFKLGELPSESKEGPFLNASSTLMKAISGLQPDQIKSMTDETQKMIETQKNMMSMLQQMRPVLQDGQQLLSSFSSIFGGSSLGKL
jgi:ABC-type cobalt transport system substrate-binding protein